MKEFEMERINEDEEGAIGIGTLIVFIAMVLVAAIAAAVLIKTAGDLQSRAERTGNDAVDDVSGGVQVLQVQGQYDEATGEVDNIRVMLVLYSGTEPVDVGRANDTDTGTPGVQRDPGNLLLEVNVKDNQDQESASTSFSAQDKTASDGAGNAVHAWTDNQALVDPHNNYGTKGILDQDSIISIDFPVQLDENGVNQIQLNPRSEIKVHFYVGAGGTGTIDITYTPGQYSAKDDQWIEFE